MGGARLDGHGSLLGQSRAVHHVEGVSGARLLRGEPWGGCGARDQLRRHRVLAAGRHKRVLGGDQRAGVDGRRRGRARSPAPNARHRTDPDAGRALTLGWPVCVLPRDGDPGLGRDVPVRRRLCLARVRRDRAAALFAVQRRRSVRAVPDLVARQKLAGVCAGGGLGDALARWTAYPTARCPRPWPRRSALLTAPGSLG